MKMLLTISVAVLLVFGGAAEGAVIMVRADGTGDYPTIQAAIDDANDGDEIICEDGIYTGEGNRDIDYLGKGIMLRSENGAESCIIDCNGTEEEPHRGFVFHSGEEANSVLDGFTIINGYILDCGGNGGGGLKISNSSPTIKNCVIQGCHVQVPRNCLGFCMGGGISIEDEYYQSPYSSPLISNCIISNNSADAFGWGGGIHSNSNDIPVIRNCVISKNKAANLMGRGGGIYCEYYSSIYVVNCTITENEAFEKGGGIQCGQITIIENCIVWNNYNDEIDGFAAVRYSNIKNGYPGESNIDADPCFVNPDANDFHLLADSPCINAGDPNYEPEPNETDLAGNPRVVDGRIDMGAYEYNLIEIEVEMEVTPAMLNCGSEGTFVKAHFVLPEGYLPEDVDINTTAVAKPLGVESEWIEVLKEGNGTYLVVAVFDREGFCEALGGEAEKYLEVTVKGWFIDGTEFYGIDTIKLVSDHWQHRENHKE